MDRNLQRIMPKIFMTSGLLCSFVYLYTEPLYLTSCGAAITRLVAISRPVFPAGKRVNFPGKGGCQSILVCKWRTLYFLSCITSTTFKTSCKSGKPTGFAPFFEQKIQGLFKDTFLIFQGLHSMHKKSLESMSFLVLPHQENFIPKVFQFVPFPLQFPLAMKSKDFPVPTAIFKNFQGLEFLF